MEKYKQKNSPQKRKFHLITGCTFLLLLILAAYLRFYHIGHLSFWNDEIFSFNSSISNFETIVARDVNMTFFHIIAHYWILLLPNISEGPLRALAASFSLMSIVTVFFLGRSIVSDKKIANWIGLITMALLTTNAYQIEYSQEFRGYSLVFFLSTLSTVFFIKAISESFDKPNITNYWWLGYACISIAAVYTHFFALFILAAHFISLLVLLVSDFRKFPFKAVVLIILIFFYFFSSLVNTIFIKGSGQISWISQPTLQSIEIFMIKISGNQGKELLILYLVIGAVGIALSFITLQKNLFEKWKMTLIVLCLIVPVMVSLTISKVKTPIFLDRYLLFIMPYSSVLFAIGIVTVGLLGGKVKILKIITLSFACVFFISSIFFSYLGVKKYFEIYQKEDWRKVSKFLNEHCSSNQSLRLYYQVYMEPNTVFYNPRLKSQIKNWEQLTREYTNAQDLYEVLPKNYMEACFVMGHIGSNSLEVRDNIRKALKKTFKKSTWINFNQIFIEIYEDPY